ncbi:hypothetical protein AB0D49_40000 [Streptomyces sp. NPDC048290]|uniref:hypothetical protein n=1 Tax=Streptomyces sp. NPDC048290 TaxID=3155811 RepID=UPI00342E7860
MGTAQRQEAPEDGSGAGIEQSRGGLRAPDHGDPVRTGAGVISGGRAEMVSTVGTDDAGAGVGTSASAYTGAGANTGAVGQRAAASVRAETQVGYRPLWVEETAKRRRLPDPVRTSAVRAVLIISVTLIQAMVTVLSTLAGSWLAFPMLISSVVSTVVATWSVLDVWVTRQVWYQRNGVVSVPSSTARSLRRERRRARRQARAAARSQERIRRPGNAGRLSHS